ncbi:MAG: late competence development ComFB family protein [Spirochaetes bacterium]|nr:late competence development ComFB family protein [Spirochaetota bacterium]
MRLKNYNEDLVLETVKVVLKDRPEVKPTRGFILDVAAFTLNRIPPKYITSERGLTRELMQSNGGGNGDRLLNVIELIALINRAIDIVAKRRHEHAAGRKTRAAADADRAAILTYFYNMPHIFGRVVDARTGSPVVEANATLWMNGQLSVPAEPGWRNPYQTSEQTKGYFSFWPQAEAGNANSLKVELRIGFDHREHRPWMLKKVLRVPGDFFVHDYIRSDKLLDLGTQTLDPS